MELSARTAFLPLSKASVHMASQVRRVDISLRVTSLFYKWDTDMKWSLIVFLDYPFNMEPHPTSDLGVSEGLQDHYTMDKGNSQGCQYLMIWDIEEMESQGEISIFSISKT